MDFEFSEADEQFRKEVKSWLASHLVGEFAALGGGSKLGEGDELELRKGWERELSSGGWLGLGWPEAYGGRNLPLIQEMIFNEEYARAGGPNRVGWFGEELLGPTLILFGTEEQKLRFLPPIIRAEEFWCQGFSEPDAGSDLASLKTAAVLDGDEWVINGQKVWTSLGHISDWIFVACRTDAKVPKKQQGITFLLCPVRQRGVDVRPIKQITNTSEFNEVFFTDARTSAEMVVGQVGEGWKVMQGTLGVERGTAFLGEQLRWREQFNSLVKFAQVHGHSASSVARQRLADAYIGLTITRLNGLRAASQVIGSGTQGRVGAISKLQWSTWHQRLGELSMDLMGQEGLILADGENDDRQYSFLFSRAETIFAGTSEIHRNIVSERMLGLPRDSG